MSKSPFIVESEKKKFFWFWPDLVKMMFGPYKNDPRRKKFKIFTFCAQTCNSNISGCDAQKWKIPTALTPLFPELSIDTQWSYFKSLFSPPANYKTLWNDHSWIPFSKSFHLICNILGCKRKSRPEKRKKHFHAAESYMIYVEMKKNHVLFDNFFVCGPISKI